MLSRLLEIKPQLKITQPKTFTHLDDNAKRRALLESKFKFINNKILYNGISLFRLFFYFYNT